MIKKLFMILLMLLQLFLLNGCSAENFTDGSKNVSEDERLACVEIYSANDKTSVTTIEDSESLSSFQEKTLFTEEWDKSVNADDMIEQQAILQKEVETNEPEYIFITYQKPVAIINDGTLEKELEITTYRNTNIVKVQISPGNVKNMPISSDYLTFYLEISDEVLEYLRSLY